MKLIVGLGNPGKEYAHTKHNIGFDCLDLLAKELKEDFREEKKFEGEMVYTRDYILLKPLTYMNLSGNSVKKVVDFYKIDLEDILVISDDLDMVTGKVRIREKGSSGGHNGLKSIMSHLGENFKRVKVGIGRNDKSVKDQVLSSFSKADRELIDASLIKCKDACIDFINDKDFKIIMGKYNG